MPPSPPLSHSPDAATESHILVCGLGPMPIGNPDRVYATGLRLWGIAKALLSAGHSVDVLEVRFGSLAGVGAEGNLHHMHLEEGPQAGDRARADILCPGLTADTQALPPEAPVNLIESQLQSSAYDALVTTTDVLNAAAAEACGDTPLWCDFNGHPMAERQSLAHLYHSDEGLAAQWDYLMPSLLRADRLSTCSAAQRLALLGELGPCGRLNRLNDGTDLAVALPPSVVQTRFTPTGKPLRGAIVPEDAFVVLWTGGYNTWADPETLAQGLAGAMRENALIHYVSTGGGIEGHDEKTFTQFQSLIGDAGVTERCRFVGWVPSNEMADYYALADVAINCDRVTLDTELGWRNRIQEWVAAEVPVLSTDLCDLTHDLAGHALIDTFPPHAPDAMARALLDLAARTPETRATAARKAREYLLEAYAPEHVYAPLTEWAKNPTRAADLRGSLPQIEGTPFDVPNNSLAHRRAEEWRQTRESSGGSGPMRRIAQRLKRTIRP